MKVFYYDYNIGICETEAKDFYDAVEIAKQKVEHFDCCICIYNEEDKVYTFDREDDFLLRYGIYKDMVKILDLNDFIDLMKG